MISLKGSRFAAIGDALDAAEFHVGAGATAPAHRIVYNPANGALTYDENGSGAGGGARFARLATGLELDHNDFIVTA